MFTAGVLLTAFCGNYFAPSFHKGYMNVHAALPGIVARFLPHCQHGENGSYCGRLEPGRVAPDPEHMFETAHTCAVTRIFISTLTGLTSFTILTLLDLPLDAPIRDFYSTMKHFKQLCLFHLGSTLVWEMLDHNVLPNGTEGLPLFIKVFGRLSLYFIASRLFLEFGCNQGYSLRKSVYYFAHVIYSLELVCFLTGYFFMKSYPNARRGEQR